jgi:Raf kinase inhibitor-like YbhB/YbcL family protein
MMPLTITSGSFPQNGAIHARHTCDGQDVSPPLAWTGVPANAKSLALIVDDPDAPDPQAPRMTWVHWVLYNMPPATGGLPESVPAGTLPAGTLQGKNDWQQIGYRGPCPPIGSHRYFHKLFALDVVLADLHQPTKAMLEKAMQGHIIESAELIGRYQRS